MKSLTFLLFWCNFITYICAQACRPDDSHMVGDYVFLNDDIDDTFRGTVATFTVADITEAYIVNTEFMDVEVSVEAQTVSVFLTDEFENYEATFQQRVIDINNNYPEFLQTEYRYRIPMPFPSRIEITQYGDEIIARDIDISNNKIIFEVIDSDYFNLTNVGTVDDLFKNHKATMFASRPLEIKDIATFTLRATDSGDPSLSYMATLIIEVDEENSWQPSPIFSSVYYETDYIVNNDSLHVAQATLLVTASESTVFYIEGDYQDNFAWYYEDGQLNIKLVKNFEQSDLEKGGVRLIVVNASISELRYARVVLVLRLPQEENSDVECLIGQ